MTNNRPSLFRVWDKEREQMLYSFEPEEQEKREYVPFVFAIGYSHWKKSSLSALMEYIGELDKHGTAIYEGDIVAREDGRWGEVRRNTSYPEFYIYGRDGRCVDYRFDTDVEIIGNIWEGTKIILRNEK